MMDHLSSYREKTRCRRLHQRLETETLDLPAEVTLGEDTIGGIVLNISFGGCAIRADETDLDGTIRPGTPITVTLPTVITHEKEPLVCDGTLVQVAHGVIHARFGPLSLQMQDGLAYLVQTLVRARLLHRRDTLPSLLPVTAPLSAKDALAAGPDDRSPRPWIWSCVPS